MGKDGGSQDPNGTLYSLVNPKMIATIVVAHQDGKEEMSGYREECPYDSGADPTAIGEAVEQVEDILQTGEAHANEHRIDDSIELLIEGGVATEQDPKHDELG